MNRNKTSANAGGTAVSAAQPQPKDVANPQKSAEKYVEISLFMASPLLLILACPTICFLIYYSQYADVHLAKLFSQPSSLFDDMVAKFPYPTVRSFLVVWCFLLFEFLLLKYVPGTVYFGPFPPSGNRPPYQQNGMPCYFISLIVFVVASWGLNLFEPSIVFNEFGPITCTLSISALLICALLLVKGRYSPSGGDNTILGNVIADYFWGIELYPYLAGVSLKQLINSRFGLMGWNIIIVSYAFKQYEVYGFLSNSMLVSVVLQSIYIAKFFYWECGYFGSIDIMHDRFGFMLCWGCMCWVTGFYTAPTLWFVHHPIQLPTLVATAIFVFGVLNIWINYDADRQRQEVRATQGKCLIWGAQPKTLIAHYRTEDGQERTNLLLYSGWWGLARHFHYVPELLLSLAWALPAGAESLFPYSYLIFLTLLLFDRSVRDEKRCSAKYGKDWNEYRKLVRSKIIPGLF